MGFTSKLGSSSPTTTRPISLTQRFRPMSAPPTYRGAVAAVQGPPQWMPTAQVTSLAALAQDSPVPQDQGPPQDQASGGGGSDDSNTSTSDDGGDDGYGPPPAQDESGDEESSDIVVADNSPPDADYSTVVVKKGILGKVWEFLFGSKTAIAGEQDSNENVVADLVERARLGDQNAMAMIAMVSQQAKAGVQRSRRFYSLIFKYIKSHPHETQVGAEDLRKAITPRACALSHGRGLSSERITAMCSRFEGESEQAFFAHSIQNYGRRRRLEHTARKLGPRAREIASFGCDVAMARSIQLVRMPNSRISKFNRIVGWELGE